MTFDLFSKVSVAGEDRIPLYKYLTEHPNSRGKVEWNFQKYLIGRDGNVLGKYAPKTLPEDPKLIADIENALKEKKP